MISYISILQTKFLLLHVSPIDKYHQTSRILFSLVFVLNIACLPFHMKMLVHRLVRLYWSRISHSKSWNRTRRLQRNAVLWRPTGSGIYGTGCSMNTRYAVTSDSLTGLVPDERYPQHNSLSQCWLHRSTLLQLSPLAPMLCVCVCVVNGSSLLASGADNKFSQQSSYPIPSGRVNCKSVLVLPIMQATVISNQVGWL